MLSRRRDLLISVATIGVSAIAVAAILSVRRWKAKKLEEEEYDEIGR